LSGPTIRGIADALGLSPATVSRSLNNSPEVREAVRTRVLTEANRRGYTLPKRGPKTARIGLAFFNATAGPRFSGYDAVIWGGVTRAAMALNYEVTVVNTLDRHSDESFSAFAARKGVEGLVLRVDEETRHLCQEVAEAGVPHIVIADRFENERINYICCNSLAASRSAVEHLLHLGHKRIAVCHSHVLDTDHCDRINGYKAALEAARIEIDPSLMISVSTEIGAGIAALNRLLSLPEPPTAIFFTDPAVTIGALRRALEVGIQVPDELSVIGVDDERLRKMTHPVFTAVCQDAAELGNQASRWLCRQLQQSGPRRRTPETCRLEIDAYLEINQTTAPRPAEPVRITPTGRRLEGPANGTQSNPQ
jgi:DNA-binding LacI/PurR family transcriptional regulator